MIQEEKSLVDLKSQECPYECGLFLCQPQPKSERI